MADLKNGIKGLILEPYYDTVYDAFRNTSFTPGRRAISTIKEHSKMLEEDLADLGPKRGNYKEKFISKFLNWMNAKSRCASVMITGPSNFPVAKIEKANRIENKHCEEFYKWRNKYFKAVRREPTPSPEEALDKALSDLDKCMLKQERMKEINKVVRKYLSKEASLDVSNLIYRDVIGLGYSEECAEEASKTNVYGRYGFESFELKNNNAKIKRLKDTVITMKNRIDRKLQWEDILFEGGRVTIEDDRLKIFHDEKPSKEIIKEIKRSGFRWSPHWKCWCRKHTGNAISAMRNLSFIKKEDR